MKKINKNTYKIHLVNISVLINLKKIEECQDYITNIFDLELDESEIIFFESILEVLNLIKEIKNQYYKDYKNLSTIEAKLSKINENIEKLKTFDKIVEKEFIEELINTLFSTRDYKLSRFFINWQNLI
jgi:glutamate mutase epsilon subunit